MIRSHIVQYSLSENMVLYYPKIKQIYLNIYFWEVYPSFRNSHIHTLGQSKQQGLTMATDEAKPSFGLGWTQGAWYGPLGPA